MTSRLVSIAVLMAVLLLPAIRNGQPFLMSDTATYVRGADAAVYKLTGHSTIWTGTLLKRYQQVATPIVGIAKNERLALPPAASQDLPVTLSGRSVFYGALLYLSALFGSFWLAALLQALAAATAIRLAGESLNRAAGGDPTTLAGLAMAAAIALTPAGYFAGYMMPDIFLPLSILALCQLTLFDETLSRRQAIFWKLLLLTGLVFHNLNIVIVLALLAFLFALHRYGPVAIAPRGLRFILGAAITAIAAQAAVATAIRFTTGVGPVSVPFASARLVADGPGLGYLQRHCPQSGFTLCRYVDRMPADSDTLLWSYDLDHGIFQAAPPADRRAIASEQIRFVIAVFRDRPGETIMASLGSIGRQARQWELSEFNYQGWLRDAFDQKLPEAELRRTRTTAAFAGTMPVRLIEITTALSFIVALGAIFLSARWRADAEYRIIIVYSAVLMVAIVLNALLCGGVSTPHDRYQMRLIWLIPFLAAALWSSRLARPARL